MREREPSLTAFSAATHRAVHQVVEKAEIFSDPLALAIVGMKAEDVHHYEELEPSRREMRLFIAARSRYAEAALERAVEQRGVRQIVILGAGLDTFAYRSRLPGNTCIFEVDHPSTQAWKLGRLEQIGIKRPASLIYAPIDFENDTLLDGLNAVGFDSAQRTFFMWLGVVPYLTEEAIDATLSMIASLPGGAEVVFDYSEPPASFSAELLAIYETVAKRVAAAGEPFLSFFDPLPLHEKLRKLGFSEIDDVSNRRLVSRYLEQATMAARRTDKSSGETCSGDGHVLFSAVKFP
jgi:methyltransferase (TIGR00027 family)